MLICRFSSFIFNAFHSNFIYKVAVNVAFTAEWGTEDWTADEWSGSVCTLPSAIFMT